MKVGNGNRIHIVRVQRYVPSHQLSKPVNSEGLSESFKLFERCRYLGEGKFTENVPMPWFPDNKALAEQSQ